MEEFYAKNCNPFIVVNGLNENKRTEVNLHNYQPTRKMNITLFDTKDDLSDITKELFYASNDSYPFAIDIHTTEKFLIPREKEAIDYTYPQFTDWAKSGGKQRLV